MQDTKERCEEYSNADDEPSAVDTGKKDAQSDGKYYYDDAHGYEDFDPDVADEDDLEATSN